MADEQITVLAQIKAKPGQEENLKQLAIGLLAPTRKEAGCISYDLHVDIANKASFMFYENWKSKFVLDEHIRTPHLQNFKAKATDLLAEPLNVTIWKKLS